MGTQETRKEYGPLATVKPSVSVDDHNGHATSTDSDGATMTVDVNASPRFGMTAPLLSSSTVDDGAGAASVTLQSSTMKCGSCTAEVACDSTNFEQLTEDTRVYAYPGGTHTSTFDACNGTTPELSQTEKTPVAGGTTRGYTRMRSVRPLCPTN